MVEKLLTNQVQESKDKHANQDPSDIEEVKRPVNPVKCVESINESIKLVGCPALTDVPAPGSAQEMTNWVVVSPVDFKKYIENEIKIMNKGQALDLKKVKSYSAWK